MYIIVVRTRDSSGRVFRFLALDSDELDSTFTFISEVFDSTLIEVELSRPSRNEKKK